MQKLINGIFLVSGTSIGAGMLAQPAAASQLGFFPACVMLLLVWVFMTLTALLIAEACIALGSNAHIITIAKHFLGFKGKILAATVYLFIVYLTNLAYICAGQDLLLKLSGFHIPEWQAATLFTLFFACLILLRSRTFGRINSIFFAALIAMYLIILLTGSFGIKVANLTSPMNWNRVYSIIPLFLTSFSFQMIVPNLASYLKYDRRHLYIVIITGTLMSAGLYILWNCVVLGSLNPDQTLALATVYAEGRFPGSSLAPSELSFYQLTINIFSILAIVTSFLGLSWGLLAFLADGFKVRAKGITKIYLWLLVILPPLLASQFWQQGFIGALEITGGYGDAILNGIIPALMFWVGIKSKEIKLELSSFTTKSIVALVLCSSLAILILQFSLQFNFLK